MNVWRPAYHPPDLKVCVCFFANRVVCVWGPTPQVAEYPCAVSGSHVICHVMDHHFPPLFVASVPHRFRAKLRDCVHKNLIDQSELFFSNKIIFSLGKIRINVLVHFHASLRDGVLSVFPQAGILLFSSSYVCPWCPFSLFCGIVSTVSLFRPFSQRLLLVKVALGTGAVS